MCGSPVNGSLCPTLLALLDNVCECMCKVIKKLQSTLSTLSGYTDQIILVSCLSQNVTSEQTVQFASRTSRVGKGELWLVGV